MDNRTSLSTHYGLNLASGILILVGWGGMFFLIRNVIPTAGPRWLFFVLLYIAIVGTAMPFVRLLNVRFIQETALITDTVIIRESLLCGLYIATCAWLQIPRALNLPVALLLALAILVIEGFLRLRERADFYASEY